MADEEKKAEGGKRWSTKLVLFVIVLVVLILLFYRKPAEAQQNFEDAESLIDISIRNLRAVGINAEAKLVGPLSESPDFAGQMKSLEEPAIFFDGQEFRVLTVTQMAEASGDYDRFISTLSEEIDVAIADLPSEGAWAVEYYFMGQVAHVALTGGPEIARGVFSDMSRISIPGVTPNSRSQNGPQLSTACSRKVLTRNIFGQDAEWVRLCVEAQCTAAVPEACATYDKSWGSWFFGKVDFTPPDIPEAGEIIGDFCRGRGYYSWSVTFAGFELLGQSASVDGLTQAGGGHIYSETTCDS